MFTATVVVSALLAIVLIISAVGKLRRHETQMKTMSRVGFPRTSFGCWHPPRSPVLWDSSRACTGGRSVSAAGVGVIAYFVGAVASHLRVKDWNVTASAILLALAVAAVTLRVQSI